MYRFDTGGLENGVVNLINHMPPDAFRHAIVALTEVTDFRHRIRRADVEFHALHKRPGHGVWQFPKLYRLFRRLKPQVVHSRNLAALEAQVPAWAAGVPLRIHGEHGWDVSDLHGSNLTYQRVRRMYRPFVHGYVALSREAVDYLVGKIGVPVQRVSHIYNGVDIQRFQSNRLTHCVATPDGCPFDPAHHWIVGSVGRMQPVKDPLTLARAFVLALELAPSLRSTLRLTMAGDGAVRSEVQKLLQEAGVADLAWLPGERADIPEIMASLQLFVLPSLAEGISNTILEAMASGLPVVATAVGGNADLVLEGQTGEIVPAADPVAMARHIVGLANDPARARTLGQAGRERVEARFSMAAMVSAYQRLYGLSTRGRPSSPARSH
jgi:sugar transferase (PEP-CTERM/EpsH1 system associated)